MLTVCESCGNETTVYPSPEGEGLCAVCADEYGYVLLTLRIGYSVVQRLWVAAEEDEDD